MLQQITLALMLMNFQMAIAAKSVAPFIGEIDNCSVKTDIVNKITTMFFECDGLKFQSEQEFLDNKFLKWGSISTNNDTYFLLIFSNGVHGEKINILSKKNKKLIHEIPASWPIEIKDKTIKYKKESNVRGEFRDYSLILK